MIKIEDIPTGVHTFETEQELLAFTIKVFEENEDWTEVKKPKNTKECLNYLKRYFKIHK